ncbi:peroxinectin A-like, partial [Limulus polyphemus]|uniref:Peroxinectin A-like n=1 Tax=Limulus polyphemus TaxID=6850 RepID=A0ABM1C441_LIMPO
MGTSYANVSVGYVEEELFNIFTQKIPTFFLRMLTFVVSFLFLNYNWVVITEGLIQLPPRFLNHYKTNDVKALSIDSTTLNQAVDKAYEKLKQQQLSNSVSGTREQINALTSFLDGSMIYGSLQNTSDALRTFVNGLLKSYTDSSGNTLLPQSPNPSEDLCSDPSQDLYCFLAGDDRLNEQPGLTAIHTVLLRQHNKIAQSLKELNPCWDDEKLYQESRRFVIAQIQMITYNEFLRVVLGNYYYYLEPRQFGYTYYYPSINPSILNEFSAAAFRFGHTLIQNQFNEINSAGSTTSFQLRESFFKPFGMYIGQLDRILRGLAAQPAQKFDKFIVEDVTNHLFQKPGEEFGLDLASFNIQRGRDHGIQSYVHYVKEFFNLPISNFSHLDVLMSSTDWTAFENLYESVEDIDLFSGGVAEYPVTNGVVGPTFAIIIQNQFLKLKYGDKYYFEHWKQPGSFTY